MANKKDKEVEQIVIIPTSWVLKKGNVLISVEKGGTDPHPKFSIKPALDGWEYFKFKDSDPALIKEIAELILEAIKL